MKIFVIQFSLQILQIKLRNYAAYSCREILHCDFFDFHKIYAVHL